jgi:cell division protein FtsQ
MYVSENELNRLLTSQNLYPVEKNLSSISLQGIERTIQNHPMIRTAECYLTPRNEVKVRVTQRVPLLRVQQASNTYFIDKDRLVMPAFSTVKDSVLVVSGSVSESLASTQIADFAEWLQGNSYWRGQVKSVYVGTPHMIYLYLHGSNQPRIVLGEIHGYKQKLAKLRTFLDKGSEATADKHYSELDLRFKGQVIGRN